MRLRPLRNTLGALAGGALLATACGSAGPRPNSLAAALPPAQPEFAYHLGESTAGGPADPTRSPPPPTDDIDATFPVRSVPVGPPPGAGATANAAPAANAQGDTGGMPAAPMGATTEIEVPEGIATPDIVQDVEPGAIAGDTALSDGPVPDPGASARETADEATGPVDSAAEGVDTRSPGVFSPPPPYEQPPPVTAVPPES